MIANIGLALPPDIGENEIDDRRGHGRRGRRPRVRSSNRCCSARALGIARLSAALLSALIGLLQIIMFSFWNSDARDSLGMAQRSTSFLTDRRSNVPVLRYGSTPKNA